MGKRLSLAVAAVLSVAASLPTHAGAPKPIEPPDRAWAVAQVATVQSSLEAPVGLPGTLYAYSIEVPSVNPIPPEGRLVRINLRTGRTDEAQSCAPLQGWS